MLLHYLVKVQTLVTDKNKLAVFVASGVYGSLLTVLMMMPLLIVMTFVIRVFMNCLYLTVISDVTEQIFIEYSTSICCFLTSTYTCCLCSVLTLLHELTYI